MMRKPYTWMFRTVASSALVCTVVILAGCDELKNSVNSLIPPSVGNAAIDLSRPSAAGDARGAALTVPAGPTYYVDQGSGNDSNSGTADAPWQTLAKAASTAKAGDTVVVKAGTYNERLVPAGSGTTDSLITFMSEKVGGAAITSGVDLSAVDYVRVEGFDIASSMPDTAGVAIQSFYASDVRRGLQIVGNYIHDAQGPNFGAGVLMNSASDIVIANNEIRDNGNTGIYFGGANSATNNVNITISGNYIHHNQQDGIHPEGQQIVIENNRIGDQSFTDNHQDGIEVYGPVDGLTIRNNMIWDTTQNIYLAGENSYIRNVQLLGNVIWTQNYTGGSVTGFNIGPGAGAITNLRIEGNTFANAWCMITDAYAAAGNNITGLSINNNIFYKTRLDVGVANDFPSDYNAFYVPGADIATWGGNWYGTLASLQAAYPGKQQHSIQGDPLFVNPDAFDFHLQAGSQCLTTGSAVADLTTDIEGKARPLNGTYAIGAYQQ